MSSLDPISFVVGLLVVWYPVLLTDAIEDRHGSRASVPFDPALFGGIFIRVLGHYVPYLGLQSVCNIVCGSRPAALETVGVYPRVVE